jgi:hypothetical protein
MGRYYGDYFARDEKGGGVTTARVFLYKAMVTNGRLET